MARFYAPLPFSSVAEWTPDPPGFREPFTAGFEEGLPREPLP